MLNKMWLISCAFLLVALILELPGIQSYVAQVKQGAAARGGWIERESGLTGSGPAVAVFAPLGGEPGRAKGESDEQLLERIREIAAQRRIAPVDARVDRVWKAIPGYNGLEVDVEKSYLLSRKLKPGEPLRLVMKEIPPAVQLDDLGAYPVYKGNPNKPMVSLMINVAWGEQYLPKMLQILERENVRATFFFDGSWLKKHIDIAKDIQKRGHELSNHAYSHKNMSQLSRSQAIDEIVKTQQLLENELGVRNELFAPPSGDYDEETVRIAHELKLRTILWTLDTVDWKNPEPQSIVRKIAARVEPGSLILMHPTASSSEALEGMIREIRKKGLSLGTVSELLSPRRIPEVESPPVF
jgi:probable sporulation protein (polysaccharide deacetylase family)